MNMTEQETLQKIRECDQKIAAEYEKMRVAARNLGENATRASAGRTNYKIFAPLGLIAFGVLLFFIGHPFWGILALGGGLYWAYIVYEETRRKQAAVDRARQSLDVMIENQKRI